MTDKRNVLASTFVQPTKPLTVPDDTGGRRRGKAKVKVVKPQTRDEYNDTLFDLTGKRAGTASRYGDAFSSNSADHQISQIVKTTKYEPELQACRWLSTIALQYLLGIDSKTVEVQCLYDEESDTVFIAANDNKHTQSLTDGEWAEWIVDEDVSPPTATPPTDKFDYRYARHAAEILLETGRYAEALEFLKHVPDIDACQSCKSRNITSKNYTEIGDEDAEVEDGPDVERFLKVLRAKNFRYVTTTQDPMHAESKILVAWREHFQGKLKKPHTLYIAGVMRPCLACYYRLERHKIELAAGKPSHTLHMKPRPGPLWFSKSGLCGATGEDHEKIAAHMEEGKEYYLSIFKTKKGDSDVMIEEVHYDYDTDSGAEDTPKEYAYGGGREKIVRKGRADKDEEGEYKPPEDIDETVAFRKQRVRTRSVGDGPRPQVTYVEPDESEFYDDSYRVQPKSTASNSKKPAPRKKENKRKHESSDDDEGYDGNDEEKGMSFDDDDEEEKEKVEKKQHTKKKPKK